ncbi:hypothetical protein HRR86_007401 [Exophiala dermatitidis]|uniref:Uncharacterized protein n=1 Tax=Exophiala dermatitidis (strain ATCC 34100 / CBS 525.76 / NIH/UT8656) TaxID=858893 RepID=H6BUE5_EXODN|nr:uncharacterized protein HMPREF1120_03812 [Exophiala dermatitidis NIH/UT8656]KAJ4506582.1 hypothetical protein HRR75_006824 [Exophiala dermatitidis]EHY55687.1 hypothetical protein HMPREF1120_03812 [Exophiala dermatitidis NIH/UT8656]KAJ4508851.1 hypothetical protein HRR74_007443 [Exophiala dermatitidis]KAJ4510103.1 hypothetical protein HRR73_006901 [Exophiala dermatitidis]KAJ4539106.1 hypothetical protein HRR77_006522 [Exophiala dermatitidis]
MDRTGPEYRLPLSRTHFLRSRGDTGHTVTPERTSITKARHTRDAGGRSTTQAPKNRESMAKDPTAGSILADNFYGKTFHASLEHYRETVHGQVHRDLEDVQKDLTAGVEDLTKKFEDHLRRLTSIEEPLQRPFDAEILKVQRSPNPENVGHSVAEEVLLLDRIEEFRKCRVEKEATLCKLWEEWEDVQFQLITLAADVYGQDSISFAQTRDEDLKPGQKERLQKALNHVHGAHGNTASDEYALLEEGLKGCEANMAEITSKTKNLMTELQQQYNIQKNKLFKSLTLHIEMLAAL